MSKSADRYFMQRCIDLAKKGAGSVSPNPMVGCVIVKNRKIIAEGYHRRYGTEHAEYLALKKAGNKARGATLYVNLEPCAHHGKTPPCTEAIIEAGIRTVVAAMKDPNPWVVGGGLKKLQRAGIHVRSGVLEPEARQLNEKFATFVTTGLPLVAVKIAQTLDGKIADAWENSQWITGKAARRHVHSLRAEYDAVLVGANTVARDNPLLTVRHLKGRNPLRVIVDGKLSAPATARVFHTRAARTVVLTSARAMKDKPRKVQQLTGNGVELLPVQHSYSLEPRQVLKTLAQLKVASVLVEGGSETVAKFLSEKLVHKVHCFIAPKIVGAGLDGWKFSKPFRIENSMVIADPRITVVGNDILIEGRLSNV